MAVKRYQLTEFEGNEKLLESAKGNLMFYADYAALERKQAETERVAVALRDALQNLYEVAGQLCDDPIPLSIKTETESALSQATGLGGGEK